MTTSIFASGWVLVSLVNGVVGTAQFPTRDLCEEGKSLAKYGMTRAAYADWLAEQKRQQEELQKKLNAKLMKAYADKCGMVPCNAEVNVQYCIIDTCYVMGRDYYSSVTKLVPSYTVSYTTTNRASFAECYPVEDK